MCVCVCVWSLCGACSERYIIFVCTRTTLAFCRLILIPIARPRRYKNFDIKFLVRRWERNGYSVSMCRGGDETEQETAWQQQWTWVGRTHRHKSSKPYTTRVDLPPVLLFTFVFVLLLCYDKLIDRKITCRFPELMWVRTNQWHCKWSEEPHVIRIMAFSGSWSSFEYKV